MIYAYYDNYGILREIINDSNNRQGSNNRLIYAYFENEDISDVSVIYKVGDVSSIQEYSDHIAVETIPYNKEINYKYFKDNTPYKFYVFVISDTVMAINGTCRATFTLHDSTSNEHETQGLLTFNIQESVVNDTPIFESQWQYLLDRLSAYEFFTKNGIIGRNDTIVDNQVAPTTYKENQLVLTPTTKTSEYNTAITIVGIKLFKVVNGKFVLIYSSLEDSDKVYKLDQDNTTQKLQISDLYNKLDKLVLDFSEFVKKSELSQVAFTGNYNDLNNKPNIPTDLSELNNDMGFITKLVSDLINYYRKDETLTKDEIIARINAIKTIKFEVYTSLDSITEPQSNVIYLIGTASPYEEYVYVESIGFELLGSTNIDLSNYVQSDNVLNTDNIVFGSGDKKVKDSGYSIDSTSLSMSSNKIPTSFIVSKAIAQFHDIVSISGDNGQISALDIQSDYRLIIDENLIIYRRILNESNKRIYHANNIIDNTHTRDYYLTLTNNNGMWNYVRTYTENVSHTEFDSLVSNTPTDITYNTETKVAQLVHDGNPIGSGAIIGIDGFTPYFEDKGLKLGDVENISADLASKEYVDSKITNEVAKKQDKLTAGENITIVDNVISASGGSGGGSSENVLEIDITQQGLDTVNQLALAGLINKIIEVLSFQVPDLSSTNDRDMFQLNNLTDEQTTNISNGVYSSIVLKAGQEKLWLKPELYGPAESGSSVYITQYSTDLCITHGYYLKLMLLVSIGEQPLNIIMFAKDPITTSA